MSQQTPAMPERPNVEGLKAVAQWLGNPLSAGSDELSCLKLFCDGPDLNFGSSLEVGACLAVISRLLHDRLTSTWKARFFARIPQANAHFLVDCWGRLLTARALLLNELQLGVADASLSDGEQAVRFECFCALVSRLSSELSARLLLEGGAQPTDPVILRGAELGQVVHRAGNQGVTEERIRSNG